MNRIREYIKFISEYLTGALLLLVYLGGLGLSTFSALPSGFSSHNHSKAMHCSTKFCTCSHQAGHCPCNQAETAASHDELAYKNCDNPVSDTYRGISISNFVVEKGTAFAAFLTVELMKNSFTNLSSQFAGDPPLHPPQLV